VPEDVKPMLGETLAAYRARATRSPVGAAPALPDESVPDTWLWTGARWDSPPTAAPHGCPPAVKVDL